MKNDNSLSISDLNSRIYEVVRATFAENLSARKASEVPSRIVPNERGQFPESVVFLSQKFIELLGYLILLHYVDDDILRCYLRLDLEEHLRKNCQFYWLSVLSEEREFLLKWLLAQKTITSRGFFGNICCSRNLVVCWESIKFRFERRIRPKRVQRHRGYRDKGTLPDPDERIRREEAKNDSWLKEEQLKMEERYILQEKNIRLFRNYLSGNGSLEESLNIEFRLLKGGKVYEREASE